MRVGLMDLSSFAKFELRGAGAHAMLSHLCANRIPGRDGGIVLGHLLTDAGFIESELTITRLAADHYFLLSAATAELQDEDRLRQALPSDGSLHARQCHRGLWHARPCRAALARGARRPHRASISATPPSPG